MEFLKKINSETLIWAGFLGMVFFIPIYTSPVFICGAFVLAVWIISGTFLKDAKLWLRSEFKIPVALLMLLPWAGLIYTPALQEGMSIALKTYYWLFSVAIITAVRTRKKADSVLKMFLAGLSLNSAISIFQFLGLIPPKDGNITGLFSGSSPWIAFSLLLAAGTLIAAFYFLHEQSKKRFLYIILIAQFLFTIGFIGGRSGYLSVIVLSPLLFYKLIRQSGITKIIILGTVALSLLLSLPLIKPRIMKVREDILLYRQGNINTSVGLRLHMWEISLSEIKNNPLLGAGTGGFKRSWELYKRNPALPFFDHPHNSFLYMMLSFGLPGLIAFCWLLLLMLKKGWRHRDSAPGFSVFAFTVVFIIGSLTDTQVLPTATAIALPIFAGISGAADAF